jgi:hypothetical protein
MAAPVAESYSAASSEAPSLMTEGLQESCREPLNAANRIRRFRVWDLRLLCSETLRLSSPSGS